MGVCSVKYATKGFVQMPVQVRKIPRSVDEAQLDVDVKVLTDKARGLGVSDVVIIGGDDVVFNDVSVEGAVIEQGYDWPTSYPQDELVSAVQLYQKGILYRIGMDASGGAQDHDLFTRLYWVTTELESAAFYMGYHLALGFSTGHCKEVLCRDERTCRAAKRSQPCIHPYKARPAFEMVGIDIARTASQVGWSDGANARFTGLVLVA
jgi:predicted metal-binding protein